MEKVFMVTIADMAWYSSQRVQKSTRHHIHTLPHHKIIGWFDGAMQGQGDLSGAGSVIKINEHLEYRWTLNCGGGTNTRAELMAAWELLTLAQILAIKDIHVIGDSKIIIDWINNVGSLQAISIECWKDEVKDLMNYFSVITFAHVYREENQDANTLSKKALTERIGVIIYNQWMDGHEGPKIFINMV
jgi:ribonuclease HI